MLFSVTQVDASLRLECVPRGASAENAEQGTGQGRNARHMLSRPLRKDFIAAHIASQDHMAEWRTPILDEVRSLCSLPPSLSLSVYGDDL